VCEADSVDLTPTTDQESFRADVRAWLVSNLPWEYGRGLPPRFDDLGQEVEFLRSWQGRLASGGWVGVAWPTEYGGRGAGPVEHYIVQDELARARAPEMVGRIGLNLAAPTLMAHGSAEQKARWLSKIRTAEELWCQLFSEPGAGSDLAGLATRADRVEGGWLVNGQKVWTSYAQFADWGVCLARTDAAAPKHRGISYLVVNMHAPGVDVRPLVQLTGEAEFNEVFLTDVFVPGDQLIGPEHEGWRVANSTLSHERGTNPRQLVIHMQLLEELFVLAEQNGSAGGRATGAALAQAYVEIRLFQLHNLRSVSRLSHGLDPGPEGSALKLYWSEMSKRFQETAMDVLGEAAPLWKGAAGNPGDGQWQRAWLYYQAASIWAGTNEIQRNVIAERVLGLPRAARRQPATAGTPTTSATASATSKGEG
jgi:alkylation response protein AidB-like acyl-CoA dehydrogenase